MRDVLVGKGFTIKLANPLGIAVKKELPLHGIEPPTPSPINTPPFLSYGYSPFGANPTLICRFSRRVPAKPPERIYLLLILCGWVVMSAVNGSFVPVVLHPSPAHTLFSSINELVMRFPQLTPNISCEKRTTATPSATTDLCRSAVAEGLPVAHGIVTNHSPKRIPLSASATQNPTSFYPNSCTFC